MNDRTLQRFWSKVNKDGPVHPVLGTRCWVWTRAKHRFGYGYFGVGNRVLYAHRISWGLTNGDPGDGCVLHRCDNPPCVNPDHLFLGSRPENTADMMRKGRGFVPKHNGSECYQAKLTEVTALEALRLYAEGSTLTELGKKYGVTIQAIYALVRRKTWRHLPWS